jgi:hypothetical protein
MTNQERGRKEDAGGLKGDMSLELTQYIVHNFSSEVHSPYCNPHDLKMCKNAHKRRRDMLKLLLIVI